MIFQNLIIVLKLGITKKYDSQNFNYEKQNLNYDEQNLNYDKQNLDFEAPFPVM